jgi:choline dehydrogenase
MFHSQFEFPAPSAEIASLGVPTHGWTMFAGLAHPKSRGSIRLSGPNVEDPVLIDANTLSHPEDLKSVVANIKTCRELGAHSALGGLVRREAYPGKSSSEALHAYARSAAVTYRHQSCTAKMGRDQMSVVDNQLHVYGIGKLRVADASIMPTITTGNTMAPCVVIGERAADMIRCSHGI